MAMFLIRGYGVTQLTQSELPATVQLDVLNIILNDYVGKQSTNELVLSAVKSIVYCSRSTREALDTILFIIEKIRVTITLVHECSNRLFLGKFLYKITVRLVFPRPYENVQRRSLT